MTMVQDTPETMGENISGVDTALLEEMTHAGILYGRKKTKTHPRMQKYIHTTRNGIEIIDIVQTVELVDQATTFLKGIIQKGGLILIAGTTPPAKELVREFSEKHALPYVVERWLGGTLTNFKTLSERLQYFLKLRADRIAGKLEKYTKKERLQFDKELARLTILFGGLEKLTKLPDALLVINASHHDTAIREARKLKIPIVAIMSNDADPDDITYPIPANDRGRQSIAWIVERLGVAITEGEQLKRQKAIKEEE